MEKYLILTIFGCAVGYLLLNVTKTLRGQKKCSGCSDSCGDCSSCHQKDK